MRIPKLCAIHVKKPQYGKCGILLSKDHPVLYGKPLLKSGWAGCAWELNLGPQIGRRRRIHWAMAALTYPAAFMSMNSPFIESKKFWNLLIQGNALLALVQPYKLWGFVNFYKTFRLEATSHLFTLHRPCYNPLMAIKYYSRSVVLLIMNATTTIVLYWHKNFNYTGHICSVIISLS